ncbi:hypothetical protein [Stygiolobus caldivivus]|uniref:Uncharacterized protein n=1 Tax=Stygiolobus caldivivus TaxID=2824673 RepID=A0A8D5U6B0_9CREN|nr:hypothetical protein [Stygiolobus caldivivus]BCU70114.1 hypothetical protein KN1_14110 [Stygiolobus caldivivus]
MRRTKLGYSCYPSILKILVDIFGGKPLLVKVIPVIGALAVILGIVFAVPYFTTTQNTASHPPTSVIQTTSPLSSITTSASQVNSTTSRATQTETTTVTYTTTQTITTETYTTTQTTTTTETTTESTVTQTTSATASGVPFCIITPSQVSGTLGGEWGVVDDLSFAIVNNSIYVVSDNGSLVKANQNTSFTIGFLIFLALGEHVQGLSNGTIELLYNNATNGAVSLGGFEFNYRNVGYAQGAFMGLEDQASTEPGFENVSPNEFLFYNYNLSTAHSMVVSEGKIVEDASIIVKWDSSTINEVIVFGNSTVAADQLVTLVNSIP